MLHVILVRIGRSVFDFRRVTEEFRVDSHEAMTDVDLPPTIHLLEVPPWDKIEGEQLSNHAVTITFVDRQELL